MNTRLKFAAAVIGVTGSFAACAAGEIAGNTSMTTQGTGGSGGHVTASHSSSHAASSSSHHASSTSGLGGSGGIGGSTGFGGLGFGGSGGGLSSTTSAMCGGTEPLCGNGMVDPGEDCDGTNFGGKTCQDFNFGGGTLMCNSCCHLIVSGCTPLENCTNGVDDNGNGLVDCMDPECFGKPGCTDSCMPTYPGMIGTGFPFDNFADTTGRPHTHNASCSSASPGGEYIWSVVAPMTGTMAIDFQNFESGFINFSVSVRTNCEMDNSEIACSNKIDMTTGDIVLGVPVVSGQTYYVMIQGMTMMDFGQFDLLLSMAPPESNCTNLVDDDMNGYTDCDDPACQPTPACVPGTKTTGSTCAASTECAVTTPGLHTPVCLNTPAFPGGYCSEWCNANAPCSAGDFCYTGLGLSKDGVCIGTCMMDTDCNTAAGYACLDVGVGTKLCLLAESNCNDYIDNNFNNLIDCQDPTCQSQPACVPGTGAIGTPCILNTQCVSSAGVNDPLCLDFKNNFYPGGYCSHWCDPTVANDCGNFAICVPEGPGGGNVCMSICLNNKQCRPGYTCQALGFSQSICHF